MLDAGGPCRWLWSWQGSLTAYPRYDDSVSDAGEDEDEEDEEGDENDEGGDQPEEDGACGL